MSILKSISLGKKQDDRPRKAELKLLFKRQMPSRTLPKHVISINKTSISLRDGVHERLNVKKGTFAGLTLFKEKLCLIISQERDPELYQLIQPGKGSTLYLQVPKINRKFIQEFKGSYVLGESWKVQNYRVFELIKHVGE